MDARSTGGKPRPHRRFQRPGGALLLRLWRDRRAATALEYGFIVSLIVIAMMASLSQVANVTTSMWNDIATKVINAH